MIAICIGHSRHINGQPEGGAVSVGGVSEWTFNAALGAQICQRLEAMGRRCVLVNRYEGSGYTAAQTWLAAHLKALGATAALELHFNSSDNPSANGHEWLHWHSSLRGRALATSLADAVRNNLPQFHARGLKELGPAARGAEFVKRTHCPAVICESFFGSNSNDWALAQLHHADLAAAIARGVNAWQGC